MLTGPAYFYYMADGNLNALIKTHLVLGLANLIMGYCLGYFFGGFRVVYGWFGAAIVSSIYIWRLFNKAFNLTFRALVGLDDMIYFFVPEDKQLNRLNFPDWIIDQKSYKAIDASM